ncbi:hypothetical protein PoB_003955800 [Plakobranchus ocellatus]|uniref:Uncharacterized protein n=1 Tax=Plakobranchus ocellatus TaxID=259542 RepID=A0AAV4B1S0_9GAST|nr:hypothetical protein PoB_003955800 [Plakobranchus ocellatus]
MALPQRNRCIGLSCQHVMLELYWRQQFTYPTSQLSTSRAGIILEATVHVTNFTAADMQGWNYTGGNSSRIQLLSCQHLSKCKAGIILEATVNVSNFTAADMRGWNHIGGNSFNDRLHGCQRAAFVPKAEPTLESAVHMSNYTCLETLGSLARKCTKSASNGSVLVAPVKVNRSLPQENHHTALRRVSMTRSELPLSKPTRHCPKEITTLPSVGFVRVVKQGPAHKTYWPLTEPVPLRHQLLHSVRSVI